MGNLPHMTYFNDHGPDRKDTSLAKKKWRFFTVPALILALVQDNAERKSLLAEYCKTLFIRENFIFA